METGSEATHQEPVWRERSDFILAAQVRDSDFVTSEQLWARRIGELTFEICCIPFFVYDLALGDVVETDAGFQLARVLHPSGHFTFRVWFGESFHPRDATVGELVTMGALVEWSSQNLLAIDASDEELAKQIADLLAERERDGVLVYETGRTK